MTGPRWATLVWGIASFAIVVGFVVMWRFAWLHDRYEAMVTTWNGDARSGLIMIDTPQLYTRERLVNDRFREAAWLERQLDNTDKLLAEGKFSQPDLVMSAIRELELRTGTTGDAEDDAEPAADSHAHPDPPGLYPTPQDQIDDAMLYRQQIRNALMGMQLDDRHDIAGNTIYRLNFHAVIVPERGSRRFAAVVVNMNETPTNASESSYFELLYDWRDELQRQIIDLVNDKKESIQIRSGLVATENSDLMTYVDNIISEIGIDDYWNKIYLPVYNVRNIRWRDSIDNFFSYYSGKKITLTDEMVAEYQQICFSKLQPSQIYEKPKLDEREIKQIVGDEASAKSDTDAEISCEPFGQNDLHLKMDVAFIVKYLIQKQLPQDCADLGEAIVDVLLGPSGTPCSDAVKPIHRQWAYIGDRSARQSLLSSFIAHQLEERPAATWNESVDGQLQLGDFFKFDTDHCGTADCYPVVRVEEQATGHCAPEKLYPPSEFPQRKALPPGRALAECLRRALGPGRVATYSIAPGEEVQRLRMLEKEALALDAADGGAGLLSMLADEVTETVALEREPVILGIGDWGARQEDQVGQRATKFAWVVLPRRRGSASGSAEQIPDHVTISAVVSAPSWWKSIDLTVATCWPEPTNLLKTIDSDKLCADEPADHVFKVALPGDATDVMTKLRFEVLTFPYVLGPQHQTEPVLEVGRSGSVTILGGRLWRSPRVIMGNQIANRIEVLPDMKGIVAHFDCIEPYPGTSGSLPASEGPEDAGVPIPVLKGQDSVSAKSQPPSPIPSVPGQARVWTSEGVTVPFALRLMPFRKRTGELIEKPCWLRERDESL